MNSTAKALRDRLTNAEREFTEAQRLVREMESRCRHNFGEPKQISIPTKEPVFSHYEGRGSDPEPVYNYVDGSKPAWVRECTECGMVQKTERTEPVVTHRPAF